MSAAKGYERIVGLPRWAEIENSFQHRQKPVTFGRRSLKYRIGLSSQGIRRLDGKKRRGICARRLWLDTDTSLDQLRPQPRFGDALGIGTYANPGANYDTGLNVPAEPASIGPELITARPSCCETCSRPLCASPPRHIQWRQQ